MNRLTQLIGEGRTIFASGLCLLSLVLLAPSALAADNPMQYFRAEDAVAYSNCVHSITNVQQGGELYGMTWDRDADYHLDRVFKSGCKDGMSVIGFLCTNVLDNAPQPTVAGYPGCTAFMVTNAAGEHLVGRNLDYVLPMAHVLLFVPKNPALDRKYSSIGSVDSGWVGYDAGQLDDGKTDLSYAALFPYYCMDGMNEKGVMVTILSLDARERPSTGAKDWMIEQFYSNRTNIVLSVAIRYLLDNAGTAAEAVQLMEKFNVFAALGGDLGIVGNYHLYVCDPSGDTRTIEWMPPENEGESWRLCEVKGSKALSNFHLTDGYGHGSNRWEIARHAIACRDGHLEAPDAMNLCRAVAQRKGTDLTSTTHWSIVYNLDALSADIATLCHYEEIFPYWFKEGNVAWEIGEAKSVKPSVETDLPAYDAKTAEAGKVYRTTASDVESEPEWRPSVTGACVSAVNRMGCTYETAGEPIHVVVKVDGTTKMLFYADYTGAVSSFLCEHIVAGMSERGVSARVARFRTSGAAGGVPASKAVFTALSNAASTSAAAAAGTLSGSLPELPGTGVIFTDAMGNVAVWPAGSELVTDDASEMVKYSLDLRQGIYEVDGEGRGQFDELPGLMRLAASADTKAIVSMGYGHLDVMLPNSNVLWRTELEGVTIPAYGVIAEPKAVAHATAKLTYESGDAIAMNNLGRLVAETSALLKVTYKTESDDYYFPDGTHTWTQTFRVGETTTTPPAPGAAQLREPDYAAADGRDWLYNHAIAGKACPDEAAESDVDLFYVYPTLSGGEKIVIDGFRGIDDATMRSDELSLSTAAGSFNATGRCFADMTHVYAPFYRQLSFDGAYDISTNAAGEVVADANARYVQTISQGPSYADVTNALTTYFAKWNNGRKLVLAGHSQGSAHLRLLMRDYFTLPENRDKAKQVICSYQVGFGMSAAEMDDITEKTKVKGQGQDFDGIKFASGATDVGVIVSYNTMGEGSSGSCTLLPPDTIAINPITWTRGADLADKGLNLGALTNAVGKADIIVPHLYGVQVVDTGFNRGEVVVCKELNDQVLPPSIFGTGSLHTKDYGAFWEGLHKNCYDRIAAATGKAPVVGRPMVYSETGNWMRYGDKDKTGSTDKPFDVFYVYPTSTGSSEYVAPVDDDMKDRALGNYRQSVDPLESYANVYAPYYRQISATGIMADPTVDGLQQNIARHVGKTDVFAALDYYFTNVNVGATRPFVLASHSQGSASLKNAFEQYFVGEKKAYLEKMIAAYTIGYTFSTDWCAKYGVTFATGAADTGVLMTWNAEGPDAPALANMLTKDPNGQAINPLNWMRDETYAPVSENLGSFRDGELVAGAADAQLKAARPGALVVSNATGYAYAPAALFGEESYHFDEWGMFQQNACANILDRGKDLTGYHKLCTTNFPKHLCVGEAEVEPQEASTSLVKPVGGTVWIQVNGLYMATVYLVPEKGYRLLREGVEVSGTAVSLYPQNLEENGEFLIPADQLSDLKVEWIQRDPDYAEEKGKDWLYNHDIAAKRYEGEPAQDPGVDLFYFYPTSVNVSDDHCVDGICDIDDEYLRSEKGALSSWNMTAKVFGDFTHVYAPYYRQTPVDKEMTLPRDGTGYDKITEYWYQRAPYADVTNALTHYFTKINKNGERPFVLAGHSHGSGMLVLAMEHFFAENPERQAWLKNMVACYAIGMGVSDKWEEAVKGYAPIATNATDAGVYVFWNTEGPGTSEGMISGLWPTNHVAGVNPLTWTRTSEYAPASLNLGGWTADDSGAVRPGLYDASNNVAHGTLVCTSPDLAARYMDASWGFGEKSLHGWDYNIYWENLRANALQRIKTMKAKLGEPDYAQIPLAGTPIDYGDPGNWVTNTGTSKPLDVLYVYPTMMLEGDSTIVPVTDAMKEKAYANAYIDSASAFAGYANVLIPAYRQINGAAVGVATTLYPEPRDFIDCLKGQTPRTDLFAALDYYFTNLNANVKRPFILAGHSQGSAMLKIAFEDYFRSNETRKGYLAKMVATYGLGYSFEKDWFDGYYPDKELTFATNATDKAALVSWNTEGLNAQLHSFVIGSGALAINPMTWTTNVDVWSETVPDAMIQARTATDYDYAPGTYALVTTNRTDYLPTVGGMGEKSLHGYDWKLWYDNIGANGLNRYATLTDRAYVDPYDFRVEHASFVVQTVGSDVLNGPAGAAVVEKDAQAFAVYTAEEGYLFGGKDSTATVALDTSVSPVRPAAGAVLPVARSASVRFERSSYEVLEGGALKVRVCRGEVEEAAQVTLSYVRNTGSYSGAYMDGKKVSFPLTLGWEKDDYEPKEIVFQTTASARAEADKTFTLQLSAKVGEVEFLKLAACTVTIVDAQGGAEAKPYVRALAWPANAGTVSGAGTLATAKAYRTLTASAKSYATFAGWYRAKADNPDVIDLESPVEPYNARYPRDIRVGYGTENEAGTYFAYFTNVLAVAAVVEPKAFDDETGAPLPDVAGLRWADNGFYWTTVGVKFSLPVDFLDDSGKGKLTVSKLPSGLAYNKKTGRIEGVPTKADSYEVQFVASNAAGKHTVTYTFLVAEIPSGAVGTFYGVVSEGDSERTGVGSVAFTAGKTGSLSAKVTRRLSGTRSFSVKGYDYIDTYTFGVAMTNAYGEILEAMLRLPDPVGDVLLEGAAFGGMRKGTLGANSETNGTFVAVRNAFATGDGDADAQQVLAAYKGTYGETLFATNGLGVAEEEVGTVQYKVQSNGNVYLAAKVAKTYDGEKAVAAKTFTGTVTGGFRYDSVCGVGGCAAALRNGTSLWSTEALFDYSTRAVTGQARYIRPNAEDKTEVVDADQFVGDGPK